MRARRVVAVTASDLHLSLRPPVARAAERDWIGVQVNYLRQLADIAAGAGAGVPVILAGDLFDRWNPPPEVINLALECLPPDCYAVPGQHDLPYHSYKDIRKSGYWTLVQAGKIRHLKPGVPAEVNPARPLRLHGFPWGFPPKPIRPHDLMLEVAVIHAYVWTRDTGYVGAPADRRLKHYFPSLRGYDVAIFGDNHRGFLFAPEREDGPVILNNGGFLRRKADERDYRPCVGLIYDDGSASRVPLDCDADCFADLEPAVAKLACGIGFETFIEELSSLGDAAVNFTDTLRRLLEREKADEGVKKLILGLVESLEK